MNDQGKMEFLTIWENYHESDTTWEPVKKFMHRYSSDVVIYCQTNDVDQDVLGDISPEPNMSSLSRVKLAYERWKTDDYAVPKEWVTKIVELFAEGIPVCDAF